MTKKRVIDFDEDFSILQRELGEVSKDLKTIKSLSKQNSSDLTLLEEELLKLSKFNQLDLGVNPNLSKKLKNPEGNLKLSTDEYFQSISVELEKQLLKEIHSNYSLLPSLTKLDIITALMIGFTGILVDLLLVRIPKDIYYLGKYRQEGSKITKWLRSLGIDQDGKLNGFFSSLEKTCKVSFDASTSKNFSDYSREVNGFYPKAHRLMSLGHDPFFGLIFGLIDMFNGNVTLIDAKGAIHVVPLKGFQNESLKNKTLAPLIWFGHILSDVCTKMGIPIPGWGFTQLLQFGKVGEKDRTIADLAKWMYLEGYDLRNFLTMSIVPATIELFTKIYFKFTLPKDELFSPLYAKNSREIHNDIRLQKLLFIAHSVATSGNLMKIMLQQGNPLAFNAAELFRFFKQSVEVGIVRSRDTTGEKIVRNRERIDKEWEKR